MKYYIDTEFLEGTQDKRFLGIKYGETKPTIDLISIAIVAEDGREYYAISKDFNLEEAWNRSSVKYSEINEISSKDGLNVMTYHTESERLIQFKKSNPDWVITKVKEEQYKEYWIRENILSSIELDLFKIHCKANTGHKDIESKGRYKALKWMLSKYGKSNQQIAEEVKEFVGYYLPEYHLEGNNPKFYGYFADYDWVAFCWLFGKMIDLPEGFPYYCIDLKQTLDSIVYPLHTKQNNFNKVSGARQNTYEESLYIFKTREGYPKQTNEHNALADARWNKQLHEFIEKL